MMVNRMVLVTALLVFGGLAPRSAWGQEARREPVSQEHLISGSPLALVVGAFHAEYEQKVKSALTAGISGGWVDFDHKDYTGVAGFLRFYPQKTALTGFYVGPHAGIYNRSYKVDGDEESSTGLGFGVDLGYGWLLGPARAFFVGVGTGVTRIITGDTGSFPVASVLNIGIAF